MDKTMHNHIFIVEDDDRVAQLLTGQLTKFGFEVSCVKDFRQIDEEVRQLVPDLILLDINLPVYDGFYWCRVLRQFTTAPVIFLSARSGEVDQVYALENGGDDYITKPFHPDLVRAKVEALLRRAYGAYKEGLHTPDKADELLTVGLLKLDVRRMTVEYMGDSESLSKTELELLRRLLQADGGVVERQQLLEALWDETDFVDDNTLTVNVTRLRKKLSVLGIEQALVTVRGMGYRFDLQTIPGPAEGRSNT